MKYNLIEVLVKFGNRTVGGRTWLLRLDLAHQVCDLA